MLIALDVGADMDSGGALDALDGHGAAAALVAWTLARTRAAAALGALDDGADMSSGGKSHWTSVRTLGAAAPVAPNIAGAPAAATFVALEICGHRPRPRALDIVVSSAAAAFVAWHQHVLATGLLVRAHLPGQTSSRPLMFSLFVRYVESLLAKPCCMDIYIHAWLALVHVTGWQATTMHI